MKTIFGLFKDYRKVEAAMDDLQNKGTGIDHMNLILLQTTAARFMDVPSGTVRVAKEGVFARDTPRGLESLLGGEKGVTVPDIGGIYAAGRRARFLADKVLETEETKEGGMRAALKDEFRVPENTVNDYLSGIQTGGLLLFVDVRDDQIDSAEDILRQHQAGLITYD